MKDRLFQILGIEHGEESMVSMLLTQSVFLGIFYGAFDISAHSLFLAIFDEKMMARGYVVSGIAGIILTGLYTWLQARLKFKNFATTNLIFVTCLALILWLTLFLYPSKWVIFIVFIMLGPLNILAMLGFWGTTGRLFTLRQGKRLFGLVDAGLIIGIIISCYAIPVLLTFKFQAHNILLISSASILVAAIIQINIGRKFTFAAGQTDKTEKRSGLSVFRENSYIRIMGIFIAFSVMTAFFIQYSFMAVTREQYPVEEDMARFLGLFTGSMMIFTLLIKLFVFSYLIRNYGLRTCLAISPILVAAFTGIAIIIGMSMGYTPASTSGFIIFFLILAVSRLFSKSLKDSIESPSFKVIYQTVDEKIRFEVQSGIDGTINEVSALSSGLLLAGLGALSFIKLIHFSWVLFIIIITWVFIAFRLYVEYRKSIRKSLEAVNTTETDAMSANREEISKNRASGIALFKSNFYDLVSGKLSIIDKTENNWFLKQIIEYSEIKQDLGMLPALRKIASKADVDEALRHLSAEVIDQLEETKGDPRKSKKSFPLPVDDEKLISARKTLASERLPQTTEILRLLRDNNIESKRYAVYIIGKFRLNDMISEVCNCLIIQGLEMDALNVLTSFGTDASEELFRFYLSLSGNINLSKLIIRILSKSNTKENTDFLFARLWSNSRQVKEAAVKSLIELGYKATDEEKDKLHQLISEIIGMITWNISAQSCLAKSNDSILLELIKSETALWNAFLFNILSIAYDSGSISKIRANIENGTVESVNFALEMIDIVIDESIKAKFVSLIDVVSDDEKLKNLHHFYPGEVPQYDQLVEDIINRDYNFISIWAKACALRIINDLSRTSTEESVIALLFSPEKILQEEAARLIGRAKRDLFSSVSLRIPGDSVRILEKIVSGDSLDKEFLLEKVRFLSDLFNNIPEDELLYPAGSIKYIKDISVETIPDNQSFILWNTCSDFSETRVFTLFNESASENKDSYLSSDDAYFYLLPLHILEDFQNMYPDRSFEINSYLNSHEIKTKENQ
jgi:ATP:ADP antiporter, AAA family